MNETHIAIVNCIESHDAVGAKCVMNMHLTYNRQAIMELIKERICRKPYEGCLHRILIYNKRLLSR